MLHTATPDVADLIGRARFLDRMRAAIAEILPEAADRQFQVAAYDHYRLTLHVEHAGWATRLRYMQPAIVRALAQRMQLHIESVEVRVRPRRDRPRAAPVPRVISHASRSHIQRVAGHVGDPGLAEALARLARAGRTP
ncbi:DUF721 domain-containing protein [Salinisphaera sp. T31B1]|uniref:DUF721 domain-containing protein n=1 Tax=Salinisphaera sp. T31B1 TaxID=727963 RepID=UPI003342A48B